MSETGGEQQTGLDKAVQDFVTAANPQQGPEAGAPPFRLMDAANGAPGGAIPGHPLEAITNTPEGTAHFNGLDMTEENGNPAPRPLRAVPDLEIPEEHREESAPSSRNDEMVLPEAEKPKRNWARKFFSAIGNIFRRRRNATPEASHLEAVESADEGLPHDITEASEQREPIAA